MKRRSFLRTFGTLVVLLGAFTLGLYRLVAQWREHRERAGALPDATLGAAADRSPRAIVAVLREEYAYLQIDEAVLDRFANDFLSDRRRQWDGTKAFPKSERLRFLMSTDFFQNGADEAEPLGYVAYYNPYVSSCHNPFARFA
jgi:hypothetical protein